MDGEGRAELRADVHELLQRLDLRELAEAAGASFARAASSTCPLHPGADNPTAFHLYCGRDGIWRWHCFTRCPPGQNDGDAISFYMRWRHVDFVTALRELARREGVRLGRGARRAARPRPLLIAAVAPALPLFWQQRAMEFAAAAQRLLWTPAGHPALDYLQAVRGLAPETILRWGLGCHLADTWDPVEKWGLPPAATSRPRRVWCPAGIVIPHWHDGGIGYIKIRRPLPGDPLADALPQVARRPGSAKYANIRGGRAGLYGMDLLRGLPTLILVEGEFDVLFAWQNAADMADVATLGSASQRPDDLAAQALAGAARILAVYDSDAAGAAGRARWLAADPRVVALDLPNLPGTDTPAHDVTAYWQAGGDVRAWLAAACRGAGAGEH